MTKVHATFTLSQDVLEKTKISAILKGESYSSFVERGLKRFLTEENLK